MQQTHRERYCGSLSVQWPHLPTHADLPHAAQRRDAAFEEIVTRCRDFVVAMEQEDEEEEKPTQKRETMPRGGEQPPRGHLSKAGAYSICNSTEEYTTCRGKKAVCPISPVPL